MGQLKKKLLYIGLSASAYISPSLMILSLFTNYWLHSSETVVVPTAKDRPTTTTTTTTVSGLFFGNINVTRLMTTKNTTIKQYYPLDHMEALYGLWEMCKITGKRSNFIIIIFFISKLIIIHFNKIHLGENIAKQSNTFAVVLTLKLD